MNFDKLFLVYIPNNSTHSTLEGTTRLAELINKYTDRESGVVMYDFLVLTDSSGALYNKPYSYITSDVNIVSLRPYKKLGVSFFHPLNADKRLTAIYYVMSDSREDLALTNTVNYPMGSGIYGWYFENNGDLSPGDVIGEIPLARIQLTNPYYIQDKEHLLSLVHASMMTNAFLDQVKLPIVKSDFDEVRARSISYELDKYLLDIANLTNLWYIVFMRTKHQKVITKTNMYAILYNYLLAYTSDKKYFGEMSDSFAIPLPINFILFSVNKFDGIIIEREDAVLFGTNCVSFKINLRNTDIIITKKDY